MALVQLSAGESDPSPDRPPRKRVVGIDLGTTNSLVATVIEGKARIIADDHGRRLVPSVVRYAATGTQVGTSAREALATNPDEVVVSVKRLMGRSHADVESNYRFKYATGTGMVRIQAGQQTVSPVEVSAAILGHLAAIAADHFDEPVERAVITVPAYFDNAQRQATKDAALLAGLEVLRLLNEPTAAALAYGLDSGEEGIYVVYDLGGGTFDVSVLCLSKGLFEVLSTAGDTSLGGDDYDEALAQLALAKVGVPSPKGVAWRVFMQEARRAKEELSTAQAVTIDVAGTSVEITRAEFITSTASLTERTVRILQSCMLDAHADEPVRGVIMVGGATRMPQIRDAVHAAVPVPMHIDLDPDEVVAIGAAAQADILAGNRPAEDWLLLDVTPLSLGIETMSGLVERIIPRNSAIPIARTQEFTTHKDGQSAMSIHVVQGERDLVQDCRSLARFSVKDIPPMPAGTARVRVTYRADTDGILSVTAREMKTGTETGVEVKPTYGLSEQEVLAMLTAASAHAKEDVAARALTEACNEAVSILTMIRKAIQDAPEAVVDDRPAIEEAMVNLENAIAVADVTQVRAATRTLDKACTGFAQRRMEQAMRQALAGKSVDDLG